jgi:hypothetical protein
MTGSLLAAAPAQAMPGSQLLGHRCQTKDPARTIENTVAALREVASVRGVTCEIDVWELADGTVIVWHDNTWGRVADHSTLPAGIRPTDRVQNATWSQVRQIRTKGGQPVATLTAMIDASAQYQVPLVTEIRNSIPNPVQLVSYARQRGASVSYYQFPTASCGTGQIDKMYAAGARVGIKSIGSQSCRVTLDMLRNKHASFITDVHTKGTPTYTRQLASIGVAFYAMGASGDTAKRAIANGAEKVMVNQPKLAATW